MNGHLFALLGTTLLSVSIAPATVEAAGPVAATALPPSGPWNIDWGDSQCMAMRGYDRPGQRVSLVLRPSPLGGATQLFVVIDDHRPASGEQVEARIEGGSEGTIKTSMLVYGVSANKRSVYLATLTPAQFATMGGASRLRIVAGHLLDKSFAITKLGAVQDKLKECVVDLNRIWSITPDTEAKLKAPPHPLKPLGSYFASEDYPAQALRERNTGTVGVRLLIDEKGVVQDCATDQTSGSAVLDAMTCIVLRQRAKFHSALDADDKPVKSSGHQQVTWMLR